MEMEPVRACTDGGVQNGCGPRAKSEAPPVLLYANQTTSQPQHHKVADAAAPKQINRRALLAPAEIFEPPGCSVQLISVLLFVLRHQQIRLL